MIASDNVQTLKMDKRVLLIVLLGVLGIVVILLMNRDENFSLPYHDKLSAVKRSSFAISRAYLKSNEVMMGYGPNPDYMPEEYTDDLEGDTTSEYDRLSDQEYYAKLDRLNADARFDRAEMLPPYYMWIPGNTH